MIKTYIKVDGMWVKVYEIHGWYELLSWVCAIGMVSLGVFLLVRNL